MTKVTAAAAVRAITRTWGACSVGTVSNLLGAGLHETAEAIRQALAEGKLVEHPTMPHLYGLPRWYA